MNLYICVVGVISEATRAGYRRRLAERHSYPDALSAEADQVLLGSLLGDGCLTIGVGNTSPVFVEDHSAAQNDYLRWKGDVLAALHPVIAQWRGGLMLRTKRAPVLAQYRSAFYPQGQKIIPECVYTRLEPLGLAVWFMDDGSVSHSTRNSVLATDCFSLDQQRRTIEWFGERWGLHPVIQFQKTRSANQLRFRVDDTTALVRLIGPHVHPLFRAKWHLDDPERWRPALTKSQASMLGNAVRTARIKAGLLTVGYHTGTVRVGQQHP